MHAPTLDRCANKTPSRPGLFLVRAVARAAVRIARSHALPGAGLLLLAASLCGCTTLSEYIHNGFKVGPNYARPPAPVAQKWIDVPDPRVRTEADDLSRWWTVFNDPVLNDLVCNAYLQNLTLRQAGFRVLEARAQLGIAVGNI